ncbi:MAG TPA: methionine aminotransferase [Bacteroidales bacterium]|nr:methionine aminotransferase [Bacteroidales bacterium]
MIKSKIPNVGTSIFSTMSELSAKYNAVNLSQGFPNFSCSDQLIDLFYKQLKMGNNQYAPMPGVFALRAAIAQKTQDLYGKSYNPETEITITAGATQALNTAITALVHEGDEVVVLEPAYDSYAPVIKLNGGIPIYFTLKSPEYKIDWIELTKLVNSRTKLIIINSPHNPTGTILTADDLQTLSRLVHGTNIIVLSDEVYEHIVFDGNKHESVISYPELAERSVVISSFGKTYHATGWKVGYALAPEAIMKEFRKIHQFQVFAVNTPAQYAYAEFMNNKSQYLELSDFYQQKRDYFLSLLEGSPFAITPSYGTYFQLLSYAGFSTMRDTDFAHKLVTDYGVASVPVSEFYHDKYDQKVLRFCFAKTNDVLEQGVERLLKIREEDFVPGNL